MIFKQIIIVSTLVGLALCCPAGTETHKLKHGKLGVFTYEERCGSTILDTQDALKGSKASLKCGSGETARFEIEDGGQYFVHFTEKLCVKVKGASEVEFYRTSDASSQSYTDDVAIQNPNKWTTVCLDSWYYNAYSYWRVTARAATDNSKVKMKNAIMKSCRFEFSEYCWYDSYYNYDSGSYVTDTFCYDVSTFTW